MAKFEIERKFLVADDSDKSLATGCVEMAQGYLSRRKESTVRVRIVDGRGYLTVKGVTTGATREEYEYEVPLEDARRMLLMCEGKVVEKRRWIVPYAGYMWEVDEFTGRLAGLTLAEVELPSEECRVELPPFVSSEVTGDPAYYNSNL